MFLKGNSLVCAIYYEAVVMVSGVRVSQILVGN